jgi:crossover junction endodeoxyribonuclease RuvC
MSEARVRVRKPHDADCGCTSCRAGAYVAAGLTLVRRPDPPESEPNTVCPMPAGQTVRTPNLPGCVMGVDGSLTGTGIAALFGDHLVGETLSPKKITGVNRLSWFRTVFKAKIILYDPALIVFEGYGFASKFGHSHSLGELGGILKLAAFEFDRPFIIVPPTVLKKFTTGKGNAEKNAVSKEAYKRYGVDLSDNNQVDAAMLAIMGRAHLGGLELTAFQKEAMQKIEIG